MRLHRAAHTRARPHDRSETQHGLGDDVALDFVGAAVNRHLAEVEVSIREQAEKELSELAKKLGVDEAHCLKVSTSSRFMNLNAIKSGHRLLLSGTPVQNDLSELLSLMSITMPKLFRNINIEEVLEGFGWDKKSGVPSSSSSAVSINQLRGMLAPFVLRRIKSDVLDQLPDKESFLEKVQMTSFQSNVYDNILYGHAKRKEKLKQQFASEILIDSMMSGTVKKGEFRTIDTARSRANVNTIVIYANSAPICVFSHDMSTFQLRVVVEPKTQAFSKAGEEFIQKFNSIVHQRFIDSGLFLILMPTVTNRIFN